MVNAAKAMGVPAKIKSALGWIFFLASTIVFRIQIWVLLFTFLGLKAFSVTALILLLVNFPLMWINRDLLASVSPVLASIYSIAFPVTVLKSVAEARFCDIQPEKAEMGTGRGLVGLSPL